MIEREMAGNPHYDAAIRAQTDQEAAMQSRLALVWEQRTANLISCSQKVYIPDSPDAIRTRLGGVPLAGVGTPTPFPEKWKKVIETALHTALSPHCYTKPYDDADTHGDVNEYGVDGLLDLEAIAGRIYEALENTDAG